MFVLIEDLQMQQEENLVKKPREKLVDVIKVKQEDLACFQKHP